LERIFVPVTAKDWEAVGDQNLKDGKHIAAISAYARAGSLFSAPEDKERVNGKIKALEVVVPFKPQAC
jgi:hypothetical protein